MGAQSSKSLAGGEVVLITGCSQGGIGHAMALAFSEAGCKVVATARSLNSLKSLENVQQVHCLQLDVLDEASISNAISSTIDKFGRIDVLVNNAGIPCLGPVAEVPIDMLDKTLRTNVLGAVSLIQKVFPLMAAQGKGKIVNIGSVAAYAPGPWMGGYTASKAAFHALTDTMRVEMKPFGIDVILVTPGAIVSNIGNRALDSCELSCSTTLKLYKPFESSMRYRAMLSQGPKSTPADEFARKTVAQILRPTPPSTFGYGHLTRIMFSLYYAPLWLRDTFFRMLLKIPGKPVRMSIKSE